MIVRSCLARRTAQTQLSPAKPSHYTSLRNFHPSFRRSDDHTPNYYETLNLPTNASPAEIKKQFYTLSKSHHPDLHPNDSNASHRFVQISEAYATLSSPDKRAAYDRNFLHVSQTGSATSNVPKGSFSSAASPAGGRPASGLSRRRTQFRGPPPSFYRSGGYGQYGGKREEAASNASHTYEAKGEAQSGPAGGASGTWQAGTAAGGMGAGMGPGGYASGFDNDVPHFDQAGHYRTHHEIERTRHKARRKVDARIHEAELEQGSVSGAGNFLLVCGVLATILGVPVVLSGLLGDGGRGKRVRVEDRST